MNFPACHNSTSRPSENCLKNSGKSSGICTWIMRSGKPSPGSVHGWLPAVTVHGESIPLSSRQQQRKQQESMESKRTVKGMGMMRTTRRHQRQRTWRLSSRGSAAGWTAPCAVHALGGLQRIRGSGRILNSCSSSSSGCSKMAERASSRRPPSHRLKVCCAASVASVSRV